MKSLQYFSLILLSSCGYYWTHGDSPSVSVPFICGDEFGLLTSEVIHRLSSCGVDVVSSEGDYTLNAAIGNCKTEKIGFRIDPQLVDGKVRRNLLATEERKSLTVELRLFRGKEMFLGPFQITADAEYDFVDGDSIQDLTFQNPSTVTVLPFSLGQLEPLDSASEAALKPLYRNLAQKIVDAIICKIFERNQKTD